MNKVSVIVPVYNTEKYIRKCVDSIINQTYSNLEIILVNDGSTDNSLSIINEYKDSRITIINNSNNGVSYSRNTGIEASTGDYILFVDSDDYLDVQCVKRCVNAISNTDVDYVVFGSKHYKPFSDTMIKEIKYNEKIIDCNIDKGFALDIELSPWNKLYRSDFINNNHLLFPLDNYFEDYIFTMDVVKNSNKIAYISDSLYCYTVEREGNLSNNQLQKAEDIIEASKRIAESYKKEGLFDRFYEELKAVAILNINDKLRQVIRQNNKDITNQYIENAFNFIKTYYHDYKSKYHIYNNISDRICTSKFLLKIYMFIKGY